MTKNVILFLDTNGFIQLRDLKDLPWRELFPDVKHVRLVVARPVIEELDDFKTSTNARRRDRSRIALKIIDEASKASDRTLLLKSRPLKITLEIAPRVKPNWDGLAELDPSSADDRLVAAALTFGSGAAVFSHDSGPRISARDVGLTAYEPPDDWHLSTEQSDDQRKIGVLERQLKAAQSSKPHLTIDFPDSGINGRITLYRRRLPPLSSDQLKRLLKRCEEEHPRAPLVATKSQFHVTAYGDGLSQYQVDSYHSDYDGFLDRTKEFLQRLHEMSYYRVVPTVDVKITNDGSVSAINFHVTMQASGGLALLSSAKSIQKLAPFPEPPEEPEPLGYLGRVHSALGGGLMPSKAHPTEIVWIDKPARYGAVEGRYGCQDFQPQRSDVRTVAMWPAGDLPTTGVLRVTAGANDVPDISEELEITVEERDEAWHSPHAIASLPKFLRKELDQRS